VHVIAPDEVAAFERCVREGGVGIFPADTVYGLACDPDSASAIERMYALKGRPPTTPSAVMFFRIEQAGTALPELGELTEAAVRRLLPGPVTVVVPNPAGRFALATGPRGLGLRVPALEGPLAPLGAVRGAVLQTSANLTGEPAPRRIADIPRQIREGVDIELDGGELAGTHSTVVDLSEYEGEGRWEILREGALGRTEVDAILSQP
jgi:L-threonylcarbamoyladenylate synthase